jgi:DNA-binding IclR family transcriptional regulator
VNIIPHYGTLVNSMQIQSIQRALDILSLFSHAQPRRGLTEIAVSTGLAKGTAHNIIHTLVQGGFLKQDRETRRYQLGHKLFTLGTIMAGTLEINQKGGGLAQQLAGRTGLTCRLAIWDNDAALVTLNAAPNYADTLSQQIGPRVVAYCSAIGRALLAYLPPEDLEAYLKDVELIPFTPKTVTDKSQLKKILSQTLNRGFAINHEELALGQTSLAATIFKSHGALAASISVSGNSDVVMGPEKGIIISDLRRTAIEISRYMGHYPMVPKERTK